MKIRPLHIVFTLIITASLLACEKNSHYLEPEPITRAQLNIILDEKSGVTDDGKEIIKTIRFIVFGNVSDNYSKLDVNKFIDLGSDAGKASDIIAQTLEVRANNDMMVAVIVNEPVTLKSQLEAVQHHGNLENIVYNIADILNARGDEVTATTGIPMTGIIRTAVSADETKTVKMVIERTVARIDIYLEAMQGSVATGYTQGSSSVTMHNLSYDSYFAMGNVDNDTRDNATISKNFGKVMKDVSDVSNKTWTATSTAEWSYSGNSAIDRRLLCSFYTAERIFKTGYSDRIAVSMANIKRANQLTGIANKDIDMISNEETTKTFAEIRRNNVYQIIAQVSAVTGITLTVVSLENWGPVQEVDIITN